MVQVNVLPMREGVPGRDGAQTNMMFLVEFEFQDVQLAVSSLTWAKPQCPFPAHTPPTTLSMNPLITPLAPRSNPYRIPLVLGLYPAIPITPHHKKPTSLTAVRDQTSLSHHQNDRPSH